MATVLPGGAGLWNIDSGEVRRMARRIRNTAESVSGLSSGDIASIRAGVGEELSGVTADKLAAALGGIDGEVRKLAASLNGIASALNAYARRLEAVDKEAGDLIKHK